MSSLDVTISSYMVMLATVVAFAFYFRSTWVRGGYSGKNRVLELFEVNRLYIHVGGAVFMLIFEVMIFSMREYPWPAWSGVLAVVGSVFGTEIWVDVKKSLKRIQD